MKSTPENPESLTVLHAGSGQAIDPSKDEFSAGSGTKPDIGGTVGNTENPTPPGYVREADWTLADLRRCNVERQAAWCPDQVPDLSFRGNELGGECGEAQNVIKKLERERHGWRGSRATVDQLAEELADVVICADLCALTAGVDLMAAVKAKFDATSVKVDLPHRLVPAAALSRVRELERLLRPFAQVADLVPDWAPDHDAASVSVGMIRRARTALAVKEGK